MLMREKERQTDRKEKKMKEMVVGRERDREGMRDRQRVEGQEKRRGRR